MAGIKKNKDSASYLGEVNATRLSLLPQETVKLDKYTKQVFSGIEHRPLGTVITDKSKQHKMSMIFVWLLPRVFSRAQLREVEHIQRLVVSLNAESRFKNLNTIATGSSRIEYGKGQVSVEMVLHESTLEVLS